MFDPDKIYHETVAAGDAWAKAHSNALFLEETRKVLRSRLMQKHLAEGKSVAAAEVAAMASEEYETHITGMVAAREKADTLRVKYQAMVELSSNRRTESVNLRTEMRL